uniref:Uncharacterized protein n=1 Tax=Erwinia amylovora ATCC BAA-2158 TaxID=889211 RepID=E5B864_ERWAM|nr:hypothetical protein predicted by Glimmer/Critica [Erwinia amylovora ATCC BAA-2158]
MQRNLLLYGASDFAAYRRHTTKWCSGGLQVDSEPPDTLFLTCLSRHVQE